MYVEKLVQRFFVGLVLTNKINNQDTAEKP